MKAKYLIWVYFAVNLLLLASEIITLRESVIAHVIFFAGLLIGFHIVYELEGEDEQKT